MLRFCCLIAFTKPLTTWPKLSRLSLKSQHYNSPSTAVIKEEVLIPMASEDEVTVVSTQSKQVFKAYGDYQSLNQHLADQRLGCPDEPNNKSGGSKQSTLQVLSLYFHLFFCIALKRPNISPPLESLSWNFGQGQKAIHYWQGKPHSKRRWALTVQDGGEDLVGVEDEAAGPARQGESSVGRPQRARYCDCTAAKRYRLVPGARIGPWGHKRRVSVACTQSLLLRTSNISSLDSDIHRDK